MALDQNLARTLLTDAVSRYESASRWAIIACVVLLIFHVMTFSPFLRSQSDLGAAENQMEALASTQDVLQSQLQTQQEKMQQLRDKLDEVLASKRAAFEALQHALETIRDPGPENESGPADSPVQAQVIQTFARPWIWHGVNFRELIENEGAVDRVRDAQTIDQLRELLQPIIEDSIIKPHFQELNEKWSEMLPELRSYVERLQDELNRSSGLLPEQRELLQEMSGHAETYLASLKKVAFTPPGDADWWHSVPGKIAAFEELADRAAEEILDARSFQVTDAALQKLIASRKELVDASEAKLEQIKKQFDQQEARLADFIAPIRGVALDLSIVVAFFPLILGALLGVVIAWPARRGAELASAVWLAQRADLIDAAGASTLTGRRSPGFAVLKTIGLAVFSIAWILVAAFQIWSRDGGNGFDAVSRVGIGDMALITGQTTLLVISGAGIALVLVAAAYRELIRRSANRQDYSPA
jgi:hypothetical protein